MCTLLELVLFSENYNSLQSSINLHVFRYILLLMILNIVFNVNSIIEFNVSELVIFIAAND